MFTVLGVYGFGLYFVESEIIESDTTMELLDVEARLLEKKIEASKPVTMSTASQLDKEGIQARSDEMGRLIVQYEEVLKKEVALKGEYKKRMHDIETLKMYMWLANVLLLCGGILSLWGFVHWHKAEIKMQQGGV